MLTPACFAINYTYDWTGNRLTETRNSVLTNYTYDADNRLTSRGTATYTYDDNGNLISVTDGGQTTNYTWDYENRLTNVALPDGTNVSYQYTTDGKMLSRTQSGVETWYAYDFMEVNGYDDMIAEYNMTGSLQARYVHGPGIDEPLAVIREGTTRYYLRDALGSVTGLTSGQTLSAVYNYEAFGDLWAGSGGIEEYGFTSRILDSSSNLYFYRARWYDSQTGHFLSKDPAGMADGPNLYIYAGNNPVVNSDPSGKQYWQVLDRIYNSLPWYLKWAFSCIHDRLDQVRRWVADGTWRVAADPTMHWIICAMICWIARCSGIGSGIAFGLIFINEFESVIMREEKIGDVPGDVLAAARGAFSCAGSGHWEGPWYWPHFVYDNCGDCCARYYVRAGRNP